MFQVNYKLFAEREEELKGSQGYFQLTSNQFKHGVYLQNELEMFSVSVYQWFHYLLEVATLLNNHSQVYIKDVDKTGALIEFKKIDYEVISICEVQAVTASDRRIVDCTVLTNSIYPHGSNNFVSLKAFKSELIEKSQGYIRHLKRINGQNQPAILTLESLMVELEVLQLS